MSPLSAIPSPLPAYGMVPRPEILRPDTLPVPGVDPTLVPGQTPGVGSTQPVGDSFGTLLGRMVEEVNAKQNAATDAVHSLQSGGNVSLHQAVIAMEEASVSFQLMVEVRNKLLEAYQEIMRMQV
jgi:flagellar hook-basal body complex protein FliE